MSEGIPCEHNRHIRDGITYCAKPEFDEALKDNDRYREALRQILAAHGYGLNDKEHPAAEIAYAALNGG